jgi:integrase
MYEDSVPVSFREAAARYLEYLELEGGRAIAIKRQQLEAWLVPFFGEKPLASLNRFDLERFRRHVLEAGRTPAMTNRFMSTISHLFHKAVEWGWLEKLPCKVTKCREDNVRTRYLDQSEIARLLEAARQDSCPVIEPFIRIALGTAMRRAEILSIELANIDCAKRHLYIPKAKCGARLQPMTASLARYLENYIARTAKPGQRWLFPSYRSKVGYVTAIEVPFRRVVAAAGLEPKTVLRHTLRHTAITHLVQTGIDLPTVQRFSGHKSIQMVFRYSHQSVEHLFGALDRLDERLQQA